MTIDTEPVYYLNAARLLAAGWKPPTDAITRLILQREALWSALAELSAHERNEDAFAAAVLAANRDGIIAAVTGHAVGTWCDERLQRNEGQVHLFNAQLRNALSAEIAKDPHAVLASLEGIDDPEGDARLLKSEAEGYVDASQYLFGANGQNVRAPAVESFSQLVPRHPTPLASTRPAALAER